MAHSFTSLPRRVGDGSRSDSKKETPAMKILALDIGKYKSVGCDYEAETGRHSFATVATTPQALHDFLVEREPDRVVTEICSIAGWICDLVRSLGIEIQVANTSDERCSRRKVSQKNDRCDEWKEAQRSAEI